MRMNTGLGGHYHSLKATAQAISEDADVLIVIIGDNPCPTIEKSGIPYERVSSTFNIIAGIKGLVKILKKYKPAVIHSFDAKADFFARSASSWLKIPKINTKCGGASPNKFYPYQKNLIIYSNEDLNYFSKNEKFKNSNIFLIPNRVYKIKDDNDRIEKLRPLVTSKTTLLRISRIGSYYKKSLLQAINLIGWLVKQNVDIQLIILGKVEDDNILNELKEHAAGLPVKFVTEPEFTSDASQLLNIADGIIGTGRGVMEAASKGKMLFTPLKDSDYPVLITENNFDDLVYYNFSERNRIEGYDQNENLLAIKNILQSDDLRKSNIEFVNKTYTDKFSIETKKDTYLKIYQSAEFYKDPVMDYLRHMAILFRFFLK
ncbi:glycosyltransferase family 4 protein [Mucilaginibacter sp. 14171R-50]|uniref:glycosyltransferase n=1 Tax=Mucilaginibacter sp. 14171R-50 TaxID=2703789 RepID=UPI00138C3D89|nr:glycosyltransferase family 4 protein [Mucilaginibacter sp. 14171R-50]QHS54274.1 glycosyltransferase family 4 protein [Mucilaginibacter sp. 14171R-50]